MRKSGLASLGFYYCHFRDEDTLEFHSIMISLHDEEGQKQGILDYVKSVVRSDVKDAKVDDRGQGIDVLSENANWM